MVKEETFLLDHNQWLIEFFNVTSLSYKLNLELNRYLKFIKKSKCFVLFTDVTKVSILKINRLFFCVQFSIDETSCVEFSHFNSNIFQHLDYII